MVYGDRRPHLVALLVPDPDWLATWMKKHKRDHATDNGTKADPASRDADVATASSDRPESADSLPVDASTEDSGKQPAPGSTTPEGEAKSNGADNGGTSSILDDPALVKAMSQAVSRVNRNLANVEKVRRCCIVREGFSVENGMLTPTLKIRRHVIQSAYRDVLERLYEA